MICVLFIVFWRLQADLPSFIPLLIQAVKALQFWVALYFPYLYRFGIIEIENVVFVWSCTLRFIMCSQGLVLASWISSPFPVPDRFHSGHHGSSDFMAAHMVKIRWILFHSIKRHSPARLICAASWKFWPMPGLSRYWRPSLRGDTFLNVALISGFQIPSRC